jgi:hypothetical protein
MCFVLYLLIYVVCVFVFVFVEIHVLFIYLLFLCFFFFVALCSVLIYNFPDRWAPRERHDVTYVSRLQSVKAAVDAQIATMAKEQPNRRIGLGAFPKFLQRLTEY